nr:MFS-type transporter [Haemonchus contortus]
MSTKNDVRWKVLGELEEPGSGRVAEVPPVSADKTAASSGSSKSGDMGIGNDLQMEKSASDPRVYKKRWAILVMFILLSASNGAQWIMYSVIAQIVADFYGVSFTAVDWTSMIYMATYIVLFIPAA